MMIDYLSMVKEFHKTFHCYYNEIPILAPSDKSLGRIRLILEELSELSEAMDNNNLVEIADSIADLLYVVFGTALAYGLPMDKIFQQVHESNMSKVGGHFEGIKFIKPSTYRPVDLSWLLEKPKE